MLPDNDRLPPTGYSAFHSVPPHALIQREPLARLRLSAGTTSTTMSHVGEPQPMEYSVTVWRTPIGEWKEVLYTLTYRREWVPERDCWRDVVVRQQRM